MSKQAVSAISIIPLLLGSILLLASGFGFISSKYTIAAGLICLIVSLLIEGASRQTT